MEGSNTLISHSYTFNQTQGLKSILNLNKTKIQDYNDIFDENLSTTNLSPIEIINDNKEVINKAKKGSKELFNSPNLVFLKHNINKSLFSYSDSSLSISENNNKIQTKKICDLKFKRRLNFNSDSFSNQK